MPLVAAQLKPVPLMSVTCEPPVATEHASSTGTCVVAPAATLNCADPAQVTLPSVAVPEREMLYPLPAGMPPARNDKPKLWALTVPLLTTVDAPFGPEIVQVMTSMSCPEGRNSCARTDPTPPWSPPGAPPAAPWSRPPAAPGGAEQPCAATTRATARPARIPIFMPPGP